MLGQHLEGDQVELKLSLAEEEVEELPPRAQRRMSQSGWRVMQTTDSRLDYVLTLAVDHKAVRARCYENSEDVGGSGELRRPRLPRPSSS